MTQFEIIYHWANNRVEGYVPIHEITNAELFTIIVDLAASGMELEKRVTALENKAGDRELIRQRDWLASLMAKRTTTSTQYWIDKAAKEAGE